MPQSSPRLIHHDGRLAELRDDLLSADVFVRNFAEVADVLATAGLRFAPMPGQDCRICAVIAPGQRTRVLAALAKAFAGQPVYADLLGHDVTLGTSLAEHLPQAVRALESPPTHQSLPELGNTAPPAPAVKVKGVRIYRPVVTGRRTLGYGPEHGCDLDFWDSATPSLGAIAAIHEPPFGWWLPSLASDSTLRIGERDYPVPAAFTQPLLEDVTFPVDAVVTWVDDTDQTWRQRHSLAQAQAQLSGHPPCGAREERFRNRDELRYCLRSIAMYAPWIRHIYLVTDDQRPTWLQAERPGLTVVSHREIFQDPTALPVFNSHAIESQLHRIAGLGEHFLYFNDDVFLGRPVKPEQFFQGNGVPLVNLDSRIIPPGPATPEDDNYVAVLKNTRALVEREFGRSTSRALSHSAHPLLRSLLAATADSFAAELVQTTRSVFRSPSDLAPITLAVSCGFLARQVAWGEVRHRHVNVDCSTNIDHLSGLLKARDMDTFCLNDGTVQKALRAQQDEMVATFLEDYFPVPGPFEQDRPTPPPQPGGLVERGR
ncbi:hypothetical protein [Kitasatospora sp. GAS1066B]|uniref:hypothetical protein n=1 Tax=Kitasatospora sp. GAS1066B TaxID=3156271 RepID=UPI0035170D82